MARNKSSKISSSDILEGLEFPTDLELDAQPGKEEPKVQAVSSSTDSTDNNVSVDSSSTAASDSTLTAALSTSSSNHANPDTAKESLNQDDDIIVEDDVPDVTEEPDSFNAKLKSVIPKDADLFTTIIALSMNPDEKEKMKVASKQIKQKKNEDMPKAYLTLSEENSDFLSLESRLLGLTKSELINYILNEHRNLLMNK